MSEAVVKTKLSAHSLVENGDVLYGAALLLQLPSFLGYAGRMWRSGHYQFFVLLIPVVIWLIKERLEQTKDTTPGDRNLLAVMLAGCGGFMVLSTFIAAHFWILSFMSLVICYVYDRYGWQGVRTIIPMWLVLVFVVPLPRGLDSLLITKLQFISSGLASWTLDAMGLVHFRSGVVLITGKEQFFAEEACSGVRSLFSSLSAVAIYGIWRNYPWWRHAINLVQTVFWVIVGNAVRIALVVWVSDNWTNRIAHGWMHDVLGIVTFVLIVLLVISTDRFIELALRKRTSPRPDTSPKTTADTQINRGNSAAQPKSRKWLLWAFVGFSALLAFCSFRLMTSQAEGILKNSLFLMPEFPRSAEGDLPEKIDNWVLEDFKYIYRGDEQIMAAESYVWIYRNGSVVVTISIDGPWEFWHDITACYRGIGWTTDAQHDFGPATVVDELNADSPNRSRVDLSKATGERALVFFAQHDIEGRIVRPSMIGGLISFELIKMNFLKSVRSIFGIQAKLDAGSRPYRLPLATVQLFCKNVRNLDDAEIGEIEKFYFQVRKLLVASPRFTNPAASE